MAICNTQEESQTTQAQEPEVISDPWNRTDPRSLINLLPEVMAGSLDRAYKIRPDLFGVDERHLLKQLRAEKCGPTPTDNRLRLSFWLEYERAQVNGKRMEMGMIHEGVCSRHFFYQEYLKAAPRVAWLACQPASYQKYADEAINFGLEQLRDALELPHAIYDENGKLSKIDLKLLELKAKITFGLEARHKGAVVQRVEQKNMNLHVSTSDKAVAKIAMEGTMEDMDKRLSDIRRRQAKARADLVDKSAEAIEVKSVLVEEKHDPIHSA